MSALPYHHASVVSLCLLLSFTTSSGQAGSSARMGINLAGPADWNTELPFVDVFRMSRPWISQKLEQPWGKGPGLELDEHGWVKRLEPNCWVETPLNTIEGGHYPGGNYTVLYEGQGQMEAWGAGQIIDQRPGRLTLKVEPARGAIWLRLKEIDPTDYIRNIRVIMPGFEKDYADKPWHPSLLKRWKGMACVRFMDFMHTNNSEIVRWSDRPVPEDATFSEKGVALEYLIDLANRLGADPWFCMPHKADDEYVRNFARLVRQRLNPELTIYVEYSNEVWNGIFAQHRYAQQQGLAKGFGHPDRPWEAAWHYTAYRSVEIFKIWQEVFGGTQRLVRVLPGWAANDYVSRQVVTFQEAFVHADALAIAPYISFNISPSSDPNAAVVATWDVEKVLTHLETHALPECTQWIKKNKAIADEHELKLIAYEAGQHLVGVGGGENHDTLTALLHQANAHLRMGLLYDRYYQAWQDAGGDLLCHFSSVGTWSKWGSWGLIEYDDSVPTPKYRSVFEWAKRWGQDVAVPNEK